MAPGACKPASLCPPCCWEGRDGGESSKVPLGKGHRSGGVGRESGLSEALADGLTQPHIQHRAAPTALVKSASDCLQQGAPGVGLGTQKSPATPAAWGQCRRPEPSLWEMLGLSWGCTGSQSRGVRARPWPSGCCPRAASAGDGAHLCARPSPSLGAGLPHTHSSHPS